MDNNDNPFLNPAWVELQRRYIDALKTFSDAPDFMKPGQSSFNDLWNQTFNNWFNAFIPELPAESRSSVNYILQQTQVFYSIIDQFAQLLHEITKAEPEGNEWQAILSRHFMQMRENIIKPNNYFGNTRGFYPWASPMNGWQLMFPGSPPGISEIFKDFDLKKFQGSFQKYFSLPGMETLPIELQSQIREYMAMWQEFFEKCREHHAVFEKTIISAMEKMEHKILQMGQNDEKISSLRELYNLWIDCNEETYQEFMMEDEYSKSFADLVNDLMNMKMHYLRFMDEIYDLSNTPKRSDVDAISRVQHELNKELEETRKEQESTADEIEKLKKELETLRHQLSVKKETDNGENDPGKE